MAKPGTPQEEIERLSIGSQWDVVRLALIQAGLAELDRSRTSPYEVEVDRHIRRATVFADLAKSARRD